MTSPGISRCHTRVDVGESRYRRLAPHTAVEYVAARGVGQCVEQAVHRAVDYYER
jgi:hypothetical protein